MERIWSETAIVAGNIGWPDKWNDQLKRVKKRKKKFDEKKKNLPETTHLQLIFKRNVFYVILDEVIADISIIFESLKKTIGFFSIFWEFKCMPKYEIGSKSRYLVFKHNKDLQEDSIDELSKF